MNRGELWIATGGVYASKPRPALIIQDDVFEGTESLTVLPLTSTLQDAALLRIRLASGGVSGLEVTSDVMIDKVTTIPRRNARARIGRLTSAQLVEVERALMVFLGLAR